MSAKLFTIHLLGTSHTMSLFGQSQKKTSKDVRGVLGRFLDGTGGPYEFDDFVSFRISDPRLETIRERCDRLHSEFPPELPGHYCGEGGVEVMRRFIQELEDDAAQPCAQRTSPAVALAATAATLPPTMQPTTPTSAVAELGSLAVFTP